MLRLSFPVLRQATALPSDGIFEDYEGLVIPRSASVFVPSVKMVVMAMLQAIQCTPMLDIRLLTACSRRWAAERPRCLSLAVKEADIPAEQQAPRQAELDAQAVLQAPFGIAALSQAAAQAMFSLQRTARPNPDAEAQAPPHNGEYKWISNRRLATMEWLPLPLSAESDQTAPSPTIPCQNKGVRQGDVTQGPDPGCAFPFATRDLPGRYGGVGEGRSVATN